MIKLNIKAKVLLILTVLITVMVIAMAIMMHIGFDKGFLNYRKAIEQQFNDQLILTLSDYYKEKGSWYDLQENRSLWHELINASSIEPFDAPHRLPPPRGFRDGPRSGPRRRPPHEQDNGKNHDDFRNRDRMSSPRREQLPPVSLFDKDKILVIGVKQLNSEEIIYQAIKSDNQTVGYLGLLKFKNTRTKQDQLFVKNIDNMLLKLGLLMIVIAVFMTFPIANYFTQLINKITAATKKIAAGDYSIRIQDNRQDELGTLVKNFNLLAQSLQSNANSQRKIMTDVAHELRTPIAVIVAEIEAIQDGIHQADEGTMQLLHRQIFALKNLVNDLHELSESDLGSLKYQMRQFDIGELVTHAYANFKYNFSQKTIELSLISNSKSCMMVGDVNRINQLLNNVLNNALQYTDEGGTTEIKLECEKHSVVIEISDSSPGLTENQLSKIFERWYRTEKSRNKNTGGSGLGLAICKEIILAHNGEISASQSSLGGISIKIQLPRNN